MADLVSFLISAAYTFAANAPLATLIALLGVAWIAWAVRAHVRVLLEAVWRALAALAGVLERVVMAALEVVAEVLVALGRLLDWVIAAIIAPLVALLVRGAQAVAAVAVAALRWLWHRLSPAAWAFVALAAYLVVTLYVSFARSWGVPLAPWQAVLWHSQVAAAILFVAFLVADRYPAITDETRRALFGYLGLPPAAAYLAWALLGGGENPPLAVAAGFLGAILVMVARVSADQRGWALDQPADPPGGAGSGSRGVTLPAAAALVCTGREDDENGFPCRYTFECPGHAPDEPATYTVALLNDIDMAFVDGIGTGFEQHLRWPPHAVSIRADGEEVAIGLAWREFRERFRWLALAVPPAGLDLRTGTRNPVLPAAALPVACGLPPESRRAIPPYRIPHDPAVIRTDSAMVGGGDCRYDFVHPGHAPDEPATYRVYVIDRAPDGGFADAKVTVFAGPDTPLDVRLSWPAFAGLWPWLARAIRAGERDDPALVVVEQHRERWYNRLVGVDLADPAPAPGAPSRYAVSIHYFGALTTPHAYTISADGVVVADWQPWSTFATRWPFVFEHVPVA